MAPHSAMNQSPSADAIDYPRANNYYPHPGMNGKPIQVLPHQDMMMQGQHGQPHYLMQQQQQQPPLAPKPGARPMQQQTSNSSLGPLTNKVGFFSIFNFLATLFDTS